MDGLSYAVSAALILLLFQYPTISEKKFQEAEEKVENRTSTSSSSTRKVEEGNVGLEISEKVPMTETEEKEEKPKSFSDAWKISLRMLKEVNNFF